MDALPTFEPNYQGKNTAPKKELFPKKMCLIKKYDLFQLKPSKNKPQYSNVEHITPESKHLRIVQDLMEHRGTVINFSMNLLQNLTKFQQKQ